MDMLKYPAVQDILRLFEQGADRYGAHRAAAPLVRKLSRDRPFLHAAIASRFADPAFLTKNRYLFIPVVSYGDIFLSINLFVPIRDGGEAFAQDHIHHHGWRILTSAVICGDGYEAIVFKKRSHESRDGDSVSLEVDEVLRHTSERERFLDAETCHVVFHPPSLTATLALWSADRVLLNQSVKRSLRSFPTIQRAVAATARSLRLDGVLGLNTFRGRYFHPENGRIVESTAYRHDSDGTREEVLACMFGFLQQVGFDRIDGLRAATSFAPADLARLTGRLAPKKPISEVGVSSDVRRRFTKRDVLDALGARDDAPVEPGR